MKTKKLTRRERQAELLKKEILDAAVKVFEQYGYEKATTKKIAEEAEVSEGTLYYYFANKRDILITLFKIWIDSVTANLKNVSRSSERDDITFLLSTGMAHQYGQNINLPIMTLFLHEARLDPDVQKIFTGMVKTARESAVQLFNQLNKEGKMRKVNNEVLALFMTLIGIGYVTLFEIGDDDITNVPLKKLTDEFAHILVSGLTPEK